MSYPEDELLPLSALSHLMYCERRAALVHIERVWEENRFTAEGRVLHERVHEAPGETRGEVRIARGLPLRSLRLGLAGVADVVEFRKIEDRSQESGVRRVVCPVEYKRGKPKSGRCDEVQLCAQGLCLEEMLDVVIEEGALFYGQTRRRVVVALDRELRLLTEGLVARLHELMKAGCVPAARYDAKRCDGCSLLDACMPKVLHGGRSVSRYMAKVFEEVEKTNHGEEGGTE